MDELAKIDDYDAKLDKLQKTNTIPNAADVKAEFEESVRNDRNPDSLMELLVQTRVSHYEDIQKMTVLIRMVREASASKAAAEAERAAAEAELARTSDMKVELEKERDEHTSAKTRYEKERIDQEQKVGLPYCNFAT